MAIAKKTKTVFFCTQCGAEHPKWQGQCRECSEWNTLAEETVSTSKATKKMIGAYQTTRLPDITTERLSGFASGIVEFDRVLGGSLLPGMVILLGGEPGIGKSTILLQLANAYSELGLNILYVTGEESLPQIKLRSQRLKAVGDNVTVMNSTVVEEISDTIDKSEYHVVLVDSIQTMASAMLDSAPGTVGQVRESAGRLIGLAKSKSIALFLVGHITKDGMVAGPKVLEHMVDTVIYFEGDSSHMYRMLRPTKNRFGSTTEVGIFEMTPAGLIEVANPSSLFLSDHNDQARPGSVVTGLCEGSRPILVEVQALVTSSNYGNPQRVAGGMDNKRLALLLAILEKRCDYPMGANDVFVSVAGGMKLSEPACDLPLMLAIVSSLTNRALPSDCMAAGEVGLSGEVRGINMIERRLTEASRMGFKRVVIPETNSSQVSKELSRKLEIISVDSIQSAVDKLIG